MKWLTRDSQWIKCNTCNKFYSNKKVGQEEGYLALKPKVSLHIKGTRLFQQTKVLWQLKDRMNDMSSLWDFYKAINLQVYCPGNTTMMECI